ncbi:ABC transporter permease [Burkholderia aenigmatica]|uniref:ABC transporter permease n=1 Tax=Burkholderia aenigmatica TaxID=2015348 RepID=UPI003B4372E7
MNAFKRTNLILGASLIVPLAVVAVIGSVYTPYGPTEVDLVSRYGAPSLTHWLGTDEFGRDVLSRIMAGATITLSVSALSVLLALLCGTTIGVISGYAGRWVDRVLMMIVEALMAFPGLLLALGLMTILGTSTWSVVLALGLAYTPSVMRIARSSTLALRQREYVVASRAMGNSGAWTVLRHVLPNCLPPLLVFSTTLFGSAILAQSALSFLGLGVQPPAPTWGGMLADSRSAMDHAIWLALFPGLAISLTLLGVNLFGDGLRDVLDPRMKGVKA